MNIRILLIACLSIITIQNLYSAAAGPEDRLESKFLEGLASIKPHLDGGGPSCYISRAFDQGPDLDRKCNAIKDYLKSAGVKTLYDVDDLLPGQSVSAFKENIAMTKFVVVLLTPKYKERAQVEGSGLNGEVELLNARLAGSSIFYVPVLLDGSADTSIPESLRPRDHLYYDLTNWHNRFDVVFSILREKMLGAVAQLPGIKAEFDAVREH